jgi:spore coat protein A
MEKKYPYKKVNLIPAICIAMIVFLTQMVQAQALLDPVTHPKFITPLPIPGEIDMTSGGTYDISMEQTVQHLGLYGPGMVPLNTTVWGYGLLGQGVSYPGPTFETQKDKALNIIWHNRLPSTGHILPTDVSLHMAHPVPPRHTLIPADEFFAAGYIPAVAHLHGGHTESGSDGLPEAWYTQETLGMVYEGNFNVNGNSYHYDNDQEAATLWYHDHALGITRLNVYAGLAGFYLLTDQNEKNLIKDNILPKKGYTVEIVIQDRMFYESGELFLPAFSGDPWFGDPDEPLELPFEPSVVAEFFGDFIVVNGVAWPNYHVEPRKYRFRLLNGSDSRFYVLKFSNDMPFLQIGTDNGFLDNAVALTQLVIAPGERADLIVDFAGMENANIILQNEGPDEPFKGANFNFDVSRPTGQIMQFSVDKNLKKKKNFQDAQVVEGTDLRPGTIQSLGNPDNTRKLALFEGEDADGRLQPLLGIINGDDEKGAGGVVNGSLAWFEDITENPGLNDVEVWEVYNATEDAHPIHLHLVTFQILERRPFTAVVNTQSQIQHDGNSGIGGYIVESSINFTGPAEVPPPNELGWKDTFIVPPGYMGKIIAKFDREGRYVWHCHILSHEDHEMMRPYEVVAAGAGARVADGSINLEQNSPNPFASGTQIRFELKQAENVQLTIYDMGGRDILYQHMDFYQEGKHALFWDGVDKNGFYLPDGIYIYRVKGESFEDTKKLIIDR